MPDYHVYILFSVARALYVGVTNNLEARVYQHQQKLTSGFTSKYNITRLVYFENYSDIRQAITREKQLKNWRRSKKVALIEAVNPEWQDLSEEWKKE